MKSIHFFTEQANARQRCIRLSSSLSFLLFRFSRRFDSLWFFTFSAFALKQQTTSDWVLLRTALMRLADYNMQMGKPWMLQHSRMSHTWRKVILFSWKFFTNDDSKSWLCWWCHVQTTSQDVSHGSGLDFSNTKSTCTQNECALFFNGSTVVICLQVGIRHTEKKRRTVSHNFNDSTRNYPFYRRLFRCSMHNVTIWPHLDRAKVFFFIYFARNLSLVRRTHMHFNLKMTLFFSYSTNRLCEYK